MSMAASLFFSYELTSISSEGLNKMTDRPTTPDFARGSKASRIKKTKRIQRDSQLFSSSSLSSSSYSSASSLVSHEISGTDWAVIPSRQSHDGRDGDDVLSNKRKAVGYVDGDRFIGTNLLVSSETVDKTMKQTVQSTSLSPTIDSTEASLQGYAKRPPQSLPLPDTKMSSNTDIPTKRRRKKTEATTNITDNTTKTKKVSNRLKNSVIVSHPPYTDYANIDKSQLSNDLVPSKEDAFPMLLHNLLETVETTSYVDTIKWQSHGRSFVIKDKVRFANEILPIYFQSQTKYSSFHRQLNCYGFLRCKKLGVDHNSFYHELFLRGRPDLAAYIPRSRQLMGQHHNTTVRQCFDPRTEPNFNQMNPMASKQFLPSHPSLNDNDRSSSSSMVGTMNTPMQSVTTSRQQHFPPPPQRTMRTSPTFVEHSESSRIQSSWDPLQSLSNDPFPNIHRTHNSNDNALAILPSNRRNTTFRIVDINETATHNEAPAERVAEAEAVSTFEGSSNRATSLFSQHMFSGSLHLNDEDIFDRTRSNNNAMNERNLFSFPVDNYGSISNIDLADHSSSHYNDNNSQGQYQSNSISITSAHHQHPLQLATSIADDQVSRSDIYRNTGLGMQIDNDTNNNDNEGSVESTSSNDVESDDLSSSESFPESMAYFLEDVDL